MWISIIFITFGHTRNLTFLEFETLLQFDLGTRGSLANVYFSRSEFSGLVTNVMCFRKVDVKWNQI